jgi:hypothetical protein
MKKISIRAVLCAAMMSTTAPAARAQEPAPAKPIATKATNWGEGVFVDLMSVDRKGSILTVKWAVRNTGTKAVQTNFELVGNNQTTFTLDEDSGTKYYVLTDKEKHGLASEHTYVGNGTNGIAGHIEPGATARYWMKLPAPPPAVKTISIFFTKVEPFESIAISDK